GMGAQYGRVSIGVLIVQDIAAVVFLAVSTAKLPSPWAALLVVLLLVGRRLWTRLMQEAGHGELLVLFGLVMALGGAVIFEQVGLKGDLGALFFGVLLAQDRKAGELARALFSLKELMLVGFFLSIGMQVTPTAQTLLLALGLICLLPLKSALFFLLLSRFRLRVRQAAFASLALGNYSEFGLIVTAIAVSKGWLVEDWLVVVAMAVVMSFLIAAPLNMRNAKIFSMLKPSLERLEHRQRLPEDEWLQLDDARVLICGMGRVGSSAREVMAERYGSERILGIEFDEDKVGQHLGAGYRVIQGDSSNPDFWHRFVKPREHVIEQVLLCMPNHESNKRTAEALRAWGYDGLLAAVIRYADEEEPLRRAGVDTVYNMYAEVGGSFARELLLTEEKSLSSRDTEPG
ncbi:MAG: cation:proton antiporter, partial [Gammaproteobacteria bacterium]|nr:cation:proton antiporter [Gammaproteobacteria bacterium]